MPRALDGRSTSAQDWSLVKIINQDQLPPLITD